MKARHPSLLTHLLLSASHSLRRMLGGAPAELHGARAQILRCAAVPGDDAAGGGGARLILEALIHPASPLTSWQPGALAVLSARDSTDSARDVCRVERAEVLENRRFRPAAHRVCKGARRVRLSLRVRPGLEQVCFGHGTASFGSFALPGARPAA